MSSGVILVTGATGAQGGAAVDALLDRGFEVRALVRDPLAPKARELGRRGVQLAAGDYEDFESLTAAALGATGVFSVQMAPRPGDPDSELRAGRRLVEASLGAGVATFVHTSVARAGDQEAFVDWASDRWNRDYWDSKSGVNDAVEAAGFASWVVLKPAYMMDNFIPPKAAWMYPSLAARGTIETALKPWTRLDLIAASDVGRFAAASFTEPARFHRKRVDLAAESLTMDQVAEQIASVTGREVAARSLSGADARRAGCPAGLVESQQWANVEGYKVDLAEARSHRLALETFAAWAQRHREDFEVGG